MELFRERLLQSATKQSDLIEIFSAIDRGRSLMMIRVHLHSSLSDHSGRITFEEFRQTIKSLGINLKTNEEIKSLFEQFDTTRNGQIDLQEFLKQLRPPVSERRQKAIWNLFETIDMNHDGVITMQDLKVISDLDARRATCSISIALDQICDTITREEKIFGSKG